MMPRPVPEALKWLNRRLLAEDCQAEWGVDDIRNWYSKPDEVERKLKEWQAENEKWIGELRKLHARLDVINPDVDWLGKSKTDEERHIRIAIDEVAVMQIQFGSLIDMLERCRKEIPDEEYWANRKRPGSWVANIEEGRKKQQRER